MFSQKWENPDARREEHPGFLSLAWQIAKSGVGIKALSGLFP
jgi:hypothetical protein